MRWIVLLIMIAGVAPGALAPAADAEEQSWSKRTPPPVKFVPPPSEDKPHDWSGVHVGVNAGRGFGTNSSASQVPGGFAFPK